MFRTSRGLAFLALCASPIAAAAQETVEDAAGSAAVEAPTADEPATTQGRAAEGASSPRPDAEPKPDEPESTPTGAPSPEPADPSPAEAAKPRLGPGGFDIFVTGYFRAPMTVGVSTRPDPGDPNGPTRTQISYGPNRTIDSNYYSFAYTRLQEQDWAELFFHAKKKHVEAVVGWMGYWFAAAGFRNYDAAWLPAMAYLTLDTDFRVGELKPNIALTAGAFWPAYGFHEKYDTYTLGRFRQMGEQLKLTVPVTPDLKLTVEQGFGTARNGAFDVLSPAPYQATVGMDLLHYENVKVAYKDYGHVALHFNHQWTRDPFLTQSGSPGQSYPDAREAKFTTIGGELDVRVPRAGRLWISPSYTRVKNGWALAEGGTELMHGVGAAGFATNYLAWNANSDNSTGTGSTFNLGFLYENKLSNLLGKEPGSVMPEVTLSAFGLFIDSQMDLPSTTQMPVDQLTQMKYGADLTVQPLNWLGATLRWDEVNYNLDESGFVFSAITGRITFSSNFLSTESIFLQYSRYHYGDHMVIAGQWPWSQDMMPGNHITQGGPYGGKKPDMDVIKLQANVTF
jgi:hypothetical protein